MNGADAFRAWRGASDTLRAVAHVLRSIAGAPDYERYEAHVRAAHPGTTPLTRDEYLRQRLEARYDRPGGRCC